VLALLTLRGSRTYDPLAELRGSCQTLYPG
jgi:hypothetical protein